MTPVQHPWHVSIGDKAPQIINAIIEIPKNSSMKYELEKTSGLLKLDRVLYSAVHYPMNYGLVPQTFFDDGDPLDILVMCAMDIVPLCIVEARVIGIMHMEDENGLDDKIISVADKDPAYMHINDIEDIPKHTLNELKNFFEYYKVLENKTVHVGELLGKSQAYDCITNSMKLYQEKFSK